MNRSPHPAEIERLDQSGNHAHIRRYLKKLKVAVVEIGCDDTRAGFKFAERVFRARPELRGA